MLQLKGIHKTFHQGTPNENPAIRGIDLTVDDGDFITIIGSNGAGKTTLFNLVSGSLQPSAGSVLYRGTDVTRQPEYKRAHFIGRIFQDPLLGTASTMTLEDNMMIACKKGGKGLHISLNNRKRAWFRQELQQLEMGLDKRLRDNVMLLSGGQRQALTLLMMVLSRPDIVLLDEHTAALDPKNAQIVLDLTADFIDRYRLTTLMITHNMGQAIQFGNRLLMMDRGEIILDIRGEEKAALTVEELVNRFHHIRRKSFQNDEALLAG